MKKLFVLLGVFCALCFVACSNFQLAGGDMGVVSLSIGDNLAREIRSAAASRNVADGTYTLTASIRGDYSDAQTVAVANGNYSGVTFTFEDVPVGKRIILDLTAKADGNYIWYGNSGKHMVVSGINNLNVAVGRVSGVLMWDNSSVKIAPYGKYESKTSLLTKESPYPVWCFDNLGNLYWYVEGENAVKRSKLQADGTYSALGDDYPGSSVFLAYDNITDSLYKMTGTKIIKAGESTEINLPEEGISPVAFAVHDNIAYIVGEVGENDDGIPQIVIRNYNLGTSSLLKENSMYQLPTSFGTNPSYQMIYHEGALYLLLRRFEINDASNASVDNPVEDNPVEHYSLGALAKIDPNTLTLDTSFGNGGYLGLSSSPVTFNDRKDSGKTFNVTYHGSTAGNDTFFGPVGFVAVMPKKLVIGDAGFAMSADGADTVSLTKKSRVVTVDLETLAFDATDIDTSYYQSDDNYSSISSKVSGYSYIVIANN